MGIETFHFRDLHPNVYLGTASDRYAGWLGQIYPNEKFAHKITRRAKYVGGKKFTEEVLPVDSIDAYFRHFRVLELDFTFYRLLLDKSDKATQTLHLLETYRQYLNATDRLILKVPQMVCAKRLRRKGTTVINETYLDPEIFTHRFYEPAVKTLDPWLAGFIFEQEYQRKKDRPPSEAFAEELDQFFSAIPKDDRYHLELRTEKMLNPQTFGILEKYGIGQILSHWTWLPRLHRQFEFSGKRFLNKANACIIRLMTPRGMRYEDAYARAHPFNRMVDGMMDKKMVEETVKIITAALIENTHIHIIINNRAGGNAPLIAQQLAWQFLEIQSQE